MLRMGGFSPLNGYQPSLRLGQAAFSQFEGGRATIMIRSVLPLFQPNDEENRRTELFDRLDFCNNFDGLLSHF